MPPFLLLSGWRPGLNKVALDKLLRDRTQLGLGEAFQCVHRLLDGEQVMIAMSSLSDAEQLAGEMSMIGAVAEAVLRPAQEPAVSQRERHG